MTGTQPDVHPLTDFQTDPTTLLQQIRTTHRPITLTVDGQPEAILQDPAEHQRLLDLAAAADASEGIRQGLEEMRQGKGRPLTEFIEELRTR